MIEFWVATSNSGKVKEYERLLGEFNVALKTPQSLSSYSYPEETGTTFQENALIKAKALSAVKPNQWVFAEDSGLEVEGLNQLPGVHSARYAGQNASDAENRAKLLKMLQLRSPKNRQAAFQAVIALISPEKEQFFFSGELKGEIATKEIGQTGFGYDSIFIPQGESQTLAELGLGFKNKVSHRFLATQKMSLHLKEVMPT